MGGCDRRPRVYSQVAQIRIEAVNMTCQAQVLRMYAGRMIRRIPSKQDRPWATQPIVRPVDLFEQQAAEARVTS